MVSSSLTTPQSIRYYVYVYDIKCHSNTFLFLFFFLFSIDLICCMKNVSFCLSVSKTGFYDEQMKVHESF